jgi:hypothetical protein
MIYLYHTFGIWEKGCGVFWGSGYWGLKQTTVLLVSILPFESSTGIYPRLFCGRSNVLYIYQNIWIMWNGFMKKLDKCSIRELNLFCQNECFQNIGFKRD